MIPRILPQLLGLLALPSILCAAPYTAWQNDYTGAEAGTLLLWKFDQPTPNTNSADTTKHSATVAANASTGVKPGKFGEAFYSATRSTDADSYAQAAGSGSLFSPSALSVEFWFRPVSDGVASSNLSYFFDKKFDKQYGIQLALSNVGGTLGTLQLAVGRGDDVRPGETGLRTATLRSGSLEWDSDLWYHIAVTYENVGGDGYLRIYRDGEEVASSVAAGFGDLVANSSLWRLGNRLGSSYGSVPGYYDNFRISSIAHEYSAIPEPSAALLILPVLGAGMFLKRNWKP